MRAFLTNMYEKCDRVFHRTLELPVTVKLEDYNISVQHLWRPEELFHLDILPFPKHVHAVFCASISRLQFDSCHMTHVSQQLVQERILVACVDEDLLNPDFLHLCAAGTGDNESSTLSKSVHGGASGREECQGTVASVFEGFDV